MYDNYRDALIDLNEALVTINEQKKTIEALTEVIAQLYFKYVPHEAEVKFRKKVKA